MAVEDTRRRRRAGRGARRWRSGAVSAGPDKKDSTGYNWVWKRGWRLDKKGAERLVYLLKTRYISIAVASVGLRMANLISSPVMIFILAVAAGAMSWIAEYMKHRLGSKGLSITFGIRSTRWVFTPWLDATPQK